jgi:hypothetical protein
LGPNAILQTSRQAIAQNPQFLEVIRQSVEFAAKDQSTDKTRVIAEHIACLLKNGFNGFVTMH